MERKLYAIPISPGNTEQVRRNFQEMKQGARKQQCEANRELMGVTGEFVVLQHLPQGDIIIAYLEGDDLSQAGKKSTASGSEYSRWVTQSVLPLYDIDLTNRGETIDTEVLEDWESAVGVSMDRKLHAIPISPGNTEQVRRNRQEMKQGARKQQCEANRELMGVTREFVLLQHLPQGDIIIAYLEGDDLSQARKKSNASGSEYSRWVTQNVLPLYDIDRTKESLDTEVLADWESAE